VPFGTSPGCLVGTGLNFSDNGLSVSRDAGALPGSNLQPTKEFRWIVLRAISGAPTARPSLYRSGLRRPALTNMPIRTVVWNWTWRSLDARSITLEIESPLDSFLGFEHAPRTDAQKKRVADMVARLNAADRLFRPDPAAECKLSRVALSSQALGLGDAEEESEHGPEPAARKKPAAGQQDEHADIDMTVVFSCAKASAARYIDIQLFNAFEGIRTIDAQVAAPQGQFKRRLSAPSPRLSWGR